MRNQLPDEEPERASPDADDPHPGETHEQHVARLFAEHNARLLRYLRARLHSHEEAKEVAQEAYVQLLGLHQPETVHLLRNYLFKTAANLATNRIKQRVQRRSKDELFFFDSDYTDARSPERVCAAEREVALVCQALAELPANCREAFRLVRFEGLSPEDAAERLDTSPRQVRRYIARALAHCLAVVELTSQGGLP